MAGSTDHELRVYRVALPDAAAPSGAARDAAAAAGGAREPVLHYMGSVKRKAAGHDRVASIRFDATGAMLAVQAAGKSVELFRCEPRHTHTHTHTHLAAAFCRGCCHAWCVMCDV